MDVAEPAADSSGGERASGGGAFLPGAAEAGGQRPGEQELGVGCHDEPCPAVCLLRGADLGRGEAEGALEGLEGVLVMQISSLGAQCGRADNAAWRVNAVAAVVAGRGLSA